MYPQFVNQDKQIISGAGDGEVRHLDINSTSVLSAWRCHRSLPRYISTHLTSSGDGLTANFYHVNISPDAK